jgi:hypothetical protein
VGEPAEKGEWVTAELPERRLRGHD